MDILLVRHLESEKNVSNSFSSDDDAESLTATGHADGVRLAAGLRSFVQTRQGVVKSIYSAGSARSIATAQYLAEALSANMVVLDDLRSIRLGTYAAKPEQEVATLNPRFIRQLELYRAGLFNSYDIDGLDDREAPRSFEDRVRRCLEDILRIPDETVKVIVAHRSPITAILIHFARQYHCYPQSFYGYVNLSLGGVSWVQSVSDQDGTIMKVNMQADKIEWWE